MSDVSVTRSRSRRARVFWDAFAGDTGASLSAHTPDSAAAGKSWELNGYAWTLDSGKVKASVAGAVATVDAGFTSATLRGLFNCQGGGTCGFAVRLVDYLNFWIVGYEPGFAGLAIYRVVAGAAVLRASAAAALSNGVDYQMICKAHGDSIYLEVVGVQSLTYGAAAEHNTATRFGIRAGNGGASDRFDDFEIYAGGG